MAIPTLRPRLCHAYAHAYAYAYALYLCLGCLPPRDRGCAASLGAGAYHRDARRRDSYAYMPMSVYLCLYAYVYMPTQEDAANELLKDVLKMDRERAICGSCGRNNAKVSYRQLAFRCDCQATTLVEPAPPIVDRGASEREASPATISVIMSVTILTAGPAIERRARPNCV